MFKVPFKAIVILILITLTACGGFKKVDQRQMPDGSKAKARKNLEEGRGVSIAGIGRGFRKTTYEFSTSNPMWRASLETLDFIPLTTVDYSGGMIITDWYSDTSNSDESIKITLRFLSNEIQSNSIKVIVHNKKCKSNQNCTVNEIDSIIKFELLKTIMAKAAEFEREAKKLKK